MENKELGVLYIVATPIGNLEDTTLRAIRILKEAGIIAAEDTRHTRKLLNHFDVRATVVSYHDFNKEEKAPVLVERLREGQSVALVCDAGTPGIADPGYYLINSCIQAGITIVPVPGPSAFLAALSVSGLPTDSFVFEGYLPKKRTARVKRLETMRENPRTLIFYESPHRLLPCLSDLLNVFGDRRAALSRELTKAFEETLRGRLSRLIPRLTGKPVRGEFTLVIEGNREITFLWD
jgi:16S rRNA (cytidine1402-2'-O)-methyltransferase